ncbi:hypothetical protein FV234_21885 [Methylobacterium sp. WL8]|nr:hypothetical protein FV234_21885 [Methylobacterium sp. WL8]
MSHTDQMTRLARGSLRLSPAIGVVTEGVILTIHEKLVHLRYTNLTNTQQIQILWEGSLFEILFSGANFETGKACLLRGPANALIPANLLLWLSVYVGEDAVDPFRSKDTRFNHERGSFQIQTKTLEKFLRAAKRMEERRWPQWRLELSRNALMYYSVAVRSGFNMMPLNIGFFGLSLECLGNVRHGKRNKHYTLGDQHFNRYLTARLARDKRDPLKKADVKRFEKKFHADVDLIHQLRNAFYGHSLLHLAADRKKLVLALRDWAVRNGHSEKFANISFTPGRLRDQVVTNSHALYKVGLRVNRIFLFLALGIHRDIPFAEYDFSTLADMSRPVVGEFKGIRFEFS